jgi:hypothetical protein
MSAVPSPPERSGAQTSRALAAYRGVRKSLWRFHARASFHRPCSRPLLCFPVEAGRGGARRAHRELRAGRHHSLRRQEIQADWNRRAATRPGDDGHIRGRRTLGRLHRARRQERSGERDDPVERASGPGAGGLRGHSEPDLGDAPASGDPDRGCERARRGAGRRLRDLDHGHRPARHDSAHDHGQRDARPQRERLEQGQRHREVHLLRQRVGHRDLSRAGDRER